MQYDKYKYIYPCRPKNSIPTSDLDFWDSQSSLISQPKINGSNCVIFTNGKDMHVMNRHAEPLTNFQMCEDEILNLHKHESGKWTVINGEYLNKSKIDETGQVFNNKLIIFDILVCNSKYLIGKTTSERLEILASLYGECSSDKTYLYSISENIFRVKSFETGFKKRYEDLSKIDMVEGLVLKRKNARLEIGSSENNNTRSQIKCRKPTKLYRF